MLPPTWVYAYHVDVMITSMNRLAEGTQLAHSISFDKSGCPASCLPTPTRHPLSMQQLAGVTQLAVGKTLVSYVNPASCWAMPPVTPQSMQQSHYVSDTLCMLDVMITGEQANGQPDGRRRTIRMTARMG